MKKDIPGYEGKYFATSNGEIYSYPRNGTIKEIRKLKYSLDKDGYFIVCLRSNNNRKTYRVAGLIAKTFIGFPVNIYMQVNHKDGVKLNNDVSNLEWVTCKVNIKHAWNKGLCCKDRESLSKRYREYGIKSRKLNIDTDIPIIRVMCRNNNISFIAKQYSVSRATIYNILKGRTYINA
jgi:hypothetical protein